MEPRLTKYPPGEEPEELSEFDEGYAVGFSAAKKRVAELAAQRDALAAALRAADDQIDHLYSDAFNAAPTMDYRLKMVDGVAAVKRQARAALALVAADTAGTQEAA